MPFRFRVYAQRIARRRILRLILWSGSHHCATGCFLEHLFYEQKMTSQVFTRLAMDLLAFCKIHQQSYPQADEVMDPCPL
jgi:lysozyme family protein